jgi:hypothetical protein
LIQIPTLNAASASILITNILRKPFQRQRMSQAFSTGQIVNRAADGGELKPLRALVV